MLTDSSAPGDRLELLSTDDRIDVLCDEFERALRRGEQPAIESFLDRVGETERAALFLELLLLDLDYGQLFGRPKGRGEYAASFPQFAAQIESAAFTEAIPSTIAPGAYLRKTSEDHWPRKLGRFELIEKAGGGASGEVWKATDPRLRRPVAIKVSHATDAGPDGLRRFLREARVAAQLRHPHIVAVHEVGREGQIAFIVSDFVEGGDLRRRLTTGPVGYRRSAEMCATVAEALHAAHEQGVVHRDLKPANILIDGNGRPHVTDFGLAKWSFDGRSVTLNGQLIGTPAYMSPEQARGDVFHIDRRTDVYGLGAVLYELLTGRPPFAGELATLVHQVIREEPMAPRRVNAAVPRDLETICLKAMAKDPARRYSTAQEMAVDLQRYLRGDRPLAQRASRIEKGWRWLRRHPAIAISLVLASCVLVASGAIISLRNENYRIQGFRQVEIASSPSGAQLAIVPIDQRTGEPTSDPQAILFPNELTPLQLQLKPGSYLIEAVLQNGKEPPDFTEIYRVIGPLDALPSKDEATADVNHQRPTVQVSIHIPRFSDVTEGMAMVPIDEQARRQNPWLPDAIYVDEVETTPFDLPAATNEPVNANGKETGSEKYILLSDAHLWAEGEGKRLLSATEYDALIRSPINAEQSGSIGHLNLPADLTGGAPEWTTTTFNYTGVGASSATAHLRSMHILRGYDDPRRFPEILRTVDGQLISSPDAESPIIGFRGAHSGAPRFVKR